MPETYPPDAPSPRSALFWDGTYWRMATVDALGHLQIDVLTSALPGGAATAANQALALVQLQLIEDIRDALQSVGTDRLIVRGEDQLFTFRGVLAESDSSVVSGAGGYIDSAPVPAGEIWVVTAITAADTPSATTSLQLDLRHDAAGYRFYEDRRAIAAGESVSWGGHVYLDPEDFIRAHYIGSLVTDTCWLILVGYRMTLET